MGDDPRLTYLSTLPPLRQRWNRSQAAATTPWSIVFLLVAFLLSPTSSPPPLQALVFVSRNPGIPRVFPTRKRKVTMSLRKGTTSTWYHTWFLCSYIRESWAYQASFPRYSAQNDRFATVLENREHTLIHEKKNKKSLRLWKWKYRVCFSINIYIYRWYEFFPSLKNKELCINYRYSEFRFWKF